MTAVSPRQRSERAELLELLLEHGILRRTESQPVLSRDGSSARWMLDSLAVTLTPQGADFAGRLVLERLQRFDGHQLATYGLTAVPILQSAILQSGGAYNGLLVRKERKTHGSRKLIEGRIDLDDPVIVIEDSIASGTNVKEGIATLEAAGLRVEGVVSLVRFGWDGGCSDLCERGYHVESVYDIFEDFMSRMEGESGPDYNPTKAFDGLRWSNRRATEGLHPAHLAREVLREYFASGEVLLPPLRLDRDDYDSTGGAWVSIRSRADIFDRHARDGFWHFPDERGWGVAEDVVRAAFRTACEMPKDTDLLDASYIGVTFFSALRKSTVGELDNDRYGIVVVSAERPEIMGGALPRMPGIRDEWQQFRHARFNNADLYPYEPYIIYRHEVTKWVEPGAPWQPSGIAHKDEEPDLAYLAEWALDLVSHPLQSRDRQGAVPSTANQIFVTIYIDGEIRGCMGSDDLTDVEQTLRTLTRSALADERFENIRQDDDSTLAVSVSLLSNRLEMGDFSREEVRIRYRHGQQALMLEQNTRAGLLLPFVATRLSLDAEDFVDEVIDKAGITRPPYNWIRFDCATWVADGQGVHKLDGGCKQSAPTLAPCEIASLQIEYLERNQRLDGSLYFGYYPFENTLYQGIDIARQAHAAWMLARAGRKEASKAALNYALAQPDDDLLALARDAFVLLTDCESDDSHGATNLAAKLLITIDRQGRITPPSEPRPQGAGADDEDAEELQNYLPGQVLLALAAAHGKGLIDVNHKQIDRAFRYYRHRFRYKRDFGQVSWMALAASAWARVTSNREHAALVFEIVDWILEFQNSHTGAFLTDHQPDTPGFTTAVYLEAVAAAFHCAAEVDAARRHRYDDAWNKGFKFLDRLIIQDRDASLLPNAGYAVGAVRENLYSGHVRIDFVQHSLAAILERYPEIKPN